MPISGWLWSLPRRRAIVTLLAAAWAGLLICAIRNPIYVGDSPGASTVVVAQINPNTAGVAVLSTIPRIGPSRAEAIVAYRDEFTKRHPGRLAFSSLVDLLHVRGIGPATLRNIEPYLSFGPRAGKGNDRK